MRSREGSRLVPNSTRRGFARWIVAGLVVLLVLGVFLVPSLLYLGGWRGYPGYGAYYGGPFFFFPFGFLFFIFIAFFAARWIFWGWGWRRGYYRSGWGYGGDALEILRMRYARGEITKEQFDQMKKDLNAQT